MPIILIWNAQAAPFERQVKRWLKELGQYGGIISKWLGGRLSQANKVERDSRAFPVVMFYNLSLTARVTGLQRGALWSEGPPGLGDSFARIGAQWNIPREISDRYTEARLMPRLLRILARMTGAARGSVTRLHDAPASMFNPGALTAVDLVGLGSLAFRSVGNGRAGILDLGTRVHSALFGSGQDVNGAALASGGAAAATLPFHMQLDNILRYITGALLVIPVMGDLVTRLGHDILLFLKNSVMDQVFAAERQVLEFRQSLLGNMNAALQTYAGAMIDLLTLVQTQMSDYFRRTIAFYAVYAYALSLGVSRFFGQFRTLWDAVRSIVGGVVHFIGMLGAMNLGPLMQGVFETLEALIDDIHYIAHGIFGPDKYEAPDPRTLTLTDFIMNQGNGPWAHRNLQEGMGSLNAALDEWPTRRFYFRQLEEYLRDNQGIDLDIEGMLDGATQLVPLLDQPALPAAPLPPALRIHRRPMPDIHQLFLDPARQAINTALIDAGNAANQGTQTITSEIVTLLEGVSFTFSHAANGAATAEFTDAHATILRQSEHEANALFPNSELRLFQSDLGPLAATYANWLVSSAPEAGMNIMSASLSGYLRFVLEEWEQHRLAGEGTPVQINETSPRILLERAQVGRVHTRRMQITATGHETDGALAARIASRFGTEISNAYASGVERLATLTANAPPNAAVSTAPSGP